VPSITKNGPKKFPKTPPNVSSSQKKEEKRLKQLPQVYLQEKEG
jgi:hypothetical protein